MILGTYVLEPIDAHNYLKFGVEIENTVSCHFGDYKVASRKSVDLCTPSKRTQVHYPNRKVAGYDMRAKQKHARRV
jgi:regulatory protein YycI of two-component signal transduction system YycFG